VARSSSATSRFGSRRLRSLGAATLLAALVASPPAGAAERAARARGGLAWVSADDLDFTGTLAAEIDLHRSDRHALAASLDTVTAIDQTLDDFTFSVRDVTIDARLRFRRDLTHGVLEVSALRRLKETVDGDGRLGFWGFAAAWETDGFRDPYPRAGLAARVEAGPAFGGGGLDADLVAATAIRWTWHLPSAAIGFEARADSLLAGSEVDSDWEIGPRLDLPAGPGRGFALYARWLAGGHPLGLSVDGLLAGFEIVEDPALALPGPGDADLEGLVDTGVSDGGDASARLLLRAATPSFLRGTRAVAEVDANVLDSPEAGDLWYRYHVGLETPVARGRAGAWFYHRSNHVLSAPNPLGVTSLNVLEIGHDSVAWEGIPGEAPSRWGSLDWRARAGWLIDSSFGENDPWHLRAGLRWSRRLPSRGFAPFVSGEVEAGDVTSLRVAVGCLAVASGWEARLGWAEDEQWFRSDDSALFLSVAARY
jgi:hypothetical protein